MTKRIAMAILLFVFAVGILPAAPMTYNTGDGSAAWSGDAQVVITNISSPPWAPNGTTGAGSLWVNSVNSGFQGGGPALGTTTTYTLNLGWVSWIHARVFADDGSHVSLSVNGNPFTTLVNSSGAPQATNCSSQVPSCPASMVWDSGMMNIGGNAILRFVTSQDVNNTPMGTQITVHSDVPEPATFALAGFAFIGLAGFRKLRPDRRL